jgi:tetratricopeptide repeat protein 8
LVSPAHPSSLPCPPPGDVWYNIGQVAIGIGDPTLAHQCLKIAVTVCPTHAESYNNLGVLEIRKGNDDQARAFFR